MPIVREGSSVHVAYTIPENIKELITDDFLKEFRNQLFRIHKHYSLETFADFGIPLNTSTSGWFAAFGKACLLTHKEQLLDYWRTLPWYDSDIFDGELAEMLVDKKLILDDSAKVLGEQLNISSDDIVCCRDCGRFYTKDMVVALTEDDEDEDYFYDEDYIQYRCLYCQDVKDTKDSKAIVTRYYCNVLDELDEYQKNHLIEEGEE